LRSRSRRARPAPTTGALSTPCSLRALPSPAARSPGRKRTGRAEHRRGPPHGGATHALRPADLPWRLGPAGSRARPPGRPPRTEVAALNVTIDREACVGCGACEEACPDVFEVGDDGVAVVIATDVSGHEDCIITAAEDCPQSAILVDGD
jgi:ferredoxin